MSLILKGIDLPKDEKKPLRIEIWSNGDVYKDYGYGYEHKEGITVQIPKKHGRLKDFDADGVHPVIVDGEYMVRVDDLDELPTILEAEWFEE